MAETMTQREQAEHFLCPALSPVPNEAIAQAETIIGANSGPVTLIGSSLGGHYATALAEKHDLRAVLVNPAALTPDNVSRFIGEQHNYHTGSAFHFTPEHATQLAAQITAPTPSRYWLLVEEGDEVLDFRDAVQRYAGCRQTVLAGGDHSFTQFPEFISQIIEFAGL